MERQATQRVGILGGTGDQGRGLAIRWASAGVSVIIGSRDAARAAAAAAEVSAIVGPTADVTGAANTECAAAADVVVAAVPWASHGETLTGVAAHLVDKVLIDCVNPLGFDRQGPYVLPVPEGSAAQQAAHLLPQTTVVAAFHHVSAKVLGDMSITDVGLDVLVLAADREAAAVVMELADLIGGARGVYAGRLRNAASVEGLTANLIAINRRYKAHSSVRITGI